MDLKPRAQLSTYQQQSAVRLVRTRFGEEALLLLTTGADFRSSPTPGSAPAPDSSHRIPAIVTSDPDPRTYSQILLIALSSL